ncbi:methionine sulfoxide reductase B [Salmonella enterica subsp. enterica]|uniref:peptide-methionine (R)-S-oxide reductase n=1 Tax=Salmonella enterica I TaxID=59201 RepID=A0A379WUV6_SALET|nr:methionine sulfoxide reductase B [Salmonella enterica subsp. enterica]
MANQPSAEELKKKLSEMQFYVTQDRGTEPPFTGRLLHNKRDGVYHCLVCDTPLFHSHTNTIQAAAGLAFTSLSAKRRFVT